MKKLQFVNVYGKPVDPAYLPRAQPKAKGPVLHRTEDMFEATRHYGFEVIGISERAAVEAEATWHAQREAKGLPAAEFDREAWLNRTKPKRAIARVFSIAEAADQAAGMLRAGGGLASRAGRRHSEGLRC